MMPLPWMMGFISIFLFFVLIGLYFSSSYVSSESECSASKFRLKNSFLVYPW